MYDICLRHEHEHGVWFGGAYNKSPIFILRKATARWYASPIFVLVVVLTRSPALGALGHAA